MYEERVYRNQVLSKFRFEVSYKESDLLISSDTEIDSQIAFDSLMIHYQEVDRYIKNNSSFATALTPLPAVETAPAIIKEMADYSQITGIGPFASVAGALASYVGKDLLQYAGEIIIENGGDIFLKINEDKRIGIYLGDKFSAKDISIIIEKQDYPFGIASSSASMGHSLNFGQADLVTVVAKNAVIADSFATALSNRIKKEDDVSTVLEFAKANSFITAIVIAFSGKLYLWGNIKLG